MSENQRLTESQLYPKILRVPRGYKEQVSLDPFEFVYALSGAKSPKLDQATLNVFTQAGFSIVEGGKLNQQNHNEFGILLGERFKSKEDIARAVVEEIWVSIPAYYSFDQVIHTPLPVVAKGDRSSQGEDKWLLETIDQKVKFIAMFLLEEKLLKPQQYMEQIDHIFEEIRYGKYDGEWAGQLWKKMGGGRIIEGYQFQEYKPSLSAYNSSMRVWVDALGKIHGAVLIRSRNKKAESYLPDDNSRELEPHTDKRTGRTIGSFEVLLTNPRSPFYLKARDFTSNSQQGGHAIYLDGKAPLNMTDAEVLLAHRINPLKPYLPESIARYASEVGEMLREVYPIFGVDFLPSDQPYYLEANYKPGFFPKAVGLPRGLSETQQLLEMIKRVAFSVGA